MKNAHLVAASLLVSANLYAQNISIVGEITKEISTPANQSHAKNNRAAAATGSQEISLLKVELSEQARDYLTQQAETVLAQSNPLGLTAENASAAQNSISLGMNNTPVLNQGSHGTCVTFAATAAIDAVLGKGDYVSQLCQLQLGNYLENNGYSMSGWDGSWGRFVMGQMDIFGFVNKDKQKRFGCGGLKEYPIKSGDVSAPMNPESFRQISEPLNMDKIAWIPVLDVIDAFTGNHDPEKTLAEVKKSLNAGDRLTFGVLLLDFDQGVMGAVGTHNQKFDSWVLTPEIAKDVESNPEFGGHEMVITGYDDNAVAVDSAKRTHRGLLTLRNSWGDKIGDKGNFYMSYDYFKLLVIEAQRIKKMS